MDDSKMDDSKVEEFAIAVIAFDAGEKHDKNKPVKAFRAGGKFDDFDEYDVEICTKIISLLKIGNLMEARNYILEALRSSKIIHDPKNDQIRVATKLQQLLKI